MYYDNLPEISMGIFKQKYARGAEKTPYDMFERVAYYLANSVEEEREFYSAMANGYIVPGGRILANTGTSGAKNTLCNCFVMPQIEDSMEGIFEAVKKAAATLQAGGGIGMDFSTIRPRGMETKGVGAKASGPVSFMRVWDAACSTIMSAGNRRGAMMGVLRVDHPDIMEFIEAKSTPNNGLTNFNLSVAVTDEFMQCLIKDDVYFPRFNGNEYWPPIHARVVWGAIMRSAYNSAEPGVIFIDRMNEKNPHKEHETIYATNPCGEQPLPPNGACVLGAINMYALRDEQNNDRLMASVQTLAKLLNRVIDKSYFPLEEQQAEALKKRRIGIGIMGYASFLAARGVSYGSDASLDMLEDALITIRCEAHRASPDSTHVTCIAPTGTTAILARNVSSGVEPVFSKGYTRKVRQPDGTKAEQEVVDASIADGFDPGVYAMGSSHLDTVSVESHLSVMAKAQEQIDASISKTVNVPEDTPFDDFKAVYERAYTLGLKGCTVYRPNDVTGSVLSVTTGKENNPKPAALPKRDGKLDGSTYKIRNPSTGNALYVTINNKNGKPYELFINSRDVGNYQWIAALTRMVSAVFRRADDATFVHEELEAIFDPAGGHWANGAYYSSLVAEIGGVIKNHVGGKSEARVTGNCPQCQVGTLRRSEGCEMCNTCGYSKC